MKKFIIAMTLILSGLFVAGCDEDSDSGSQAQVPEAVQPFITQKGAEAGADGVQTYKVMGIQDLREETEATDTSNESVHMFDFYLVLLPSGKANLIYSRQTIVGGQIHPPSGYVVSSVWVWTGEEIFIEGVARLRIEGEALQMNLEEPVAEQYREHFEKFGGRTLTLEPKQVYLSETDLQ